MNRYELLKKVLINKKCFKLVCGAGNEDVEEVKRLSTIYTIAGTTILDLSANVEVVKAAKQGVEFAYKIASSLGKKIEILPYLNVSIGLKGDPHVRKAKIDLDLCEKCGECISSCQQEAIKDNFVILSQRCIGCGKCEEVCGFNAIKFTHQKADFDKILPGCKKLGVETMELHAIIQDDKAVMNDWKLLNKIITNNFLSMCLDRSLLSNKDIEERIKQAYEITKDRLVVQADGVPMSGEGDDYNTTLQAIACADIVKKTNVPAMILLSGGTNAKTGLLAKQCGVDANGVAIGSFARKIVREYTKRNDFDSNYDVLKKAVTIAESLIKENIEALSG